MVREAPSADLPSELAGGRFRILSVLGRGSQGLTFAAEDRQRRGQVAIKRFQVQGAPSWKQVELAEREAEVLAGLSHPNLPAYVTHFEEAGALYLVMELIEGKTLATLMRERALSQEDVLAFMTSVAETLRYLHGRAPPIIHRDVKPHNVIRRPDGSFVLVDFGSVRDKLRPEGGSTVVGTFGYMAPEQFQGRALPVTDTYGLGATAVACLSGESPEKLPHRGLAIDVRQALTGRVTSRLIELLEKMLNPDPERRPADLRSALAAVTTTEAEAAPRSARGKPGREDVRAAPATTPTTGRLGAVPLLILGLTALLIAAERPLLPVWVLLAGLSLFFYVRYAWREERQAQRFRVEPTPAEHDADDAVSAASRARAAPPREASRSHRPSNDRR